MTLLNDQDPNKDNPEWMKGLPEDLGKTPALAKFVPGENEALVPMPLSVAKSYVELEKKMGDPDSLLRIPGEKATPEERDAFFTKLGRPAKLEEYEIAGEDAKNPRAKAINDRFRKVAFEHGVPKPALKALSAEMTAIASEFQGNKDGILAVPDAEQSLQAEWKSDYPLNLKKASLAARTLGGDELLGLVNQSGLGANPVFLKALVKATAFFPAETMKGIEGSGSTPPALTREKLFEMKKDPKYQTDAVYRQEVDDGYKRLFPGEVKIAATDRHEVL